MQHSSHKINVYFVSNVSLPQPYCYCDQNAQNSEYSDPFKTSPTLKCFHSFCGFILRVCLLLGVSGHFNISMLSFFVFRDWKCSKMTGIRWQNTLELEPKTNAFFIFRGYQLKIRSQKTSSWVSFEPQSAQDPNLT